MQGTDDVGERIRAAMDDLGVSKKALVVSRDYSSSVSLIFLEDGGERCIMVAFFFVWLFFLHTDTDGPRGNKSHQRGHCQKAFRRIC